MILDFIMLLFLNPKKLGFTLSESINYQKHIKKFLIGLKKKHNFFFNSFNTKYLEKILRVSTNFIFNFLMREPLTHLFCKNF
jgi:hypothetical protein